MARMESGRPRRESGRQPAPASAGTDHDELASYRLRRERELSSLYATTRSLAALGEVDEVLPSIVRHAHELIGSDFAYLSLLDAEGNLALKASAGTISPEFSSARMPQGDGLGGRVIESRAPYWVSNYREARALRHNSAFDLLVAGEGLMALLGVPLLVGERAVGVLFAADRTERPFETDEVALFSAFADHAAIALNNARLYEESRISVQQLQEAYRTIEDQVTTMERAAAVHEALTHVVLTGGGPGDLAQVLVEHLRGMVTILDRDDTVVASRSSGADAADTGREPARELLEAARRTGRCATAEGEDGAVHSVAVIQAGGSHLGSLSLTRHTAPEPPDIRMLERSAQIMGLLILMRDARVEAEERVCGELLTELLSRPAVHPAQRDRALVRGVDVDRLDVLVVADCPGKSTSHVVRELHAASPEWSGLAGEYLGRATMLLRADDVQEAAGALHHRLRHTLGAPALVVADRIQGHERSRSFTLARRCLEVMRSLGETDRASTTQQYAMYALVFDPERSHDLDRFLTDVLGPLLEYDRRRSTDLVTTASAYFAHSGNLSRTARSLHVHMNTLLKRLERIGSLLGGDWRSPDAALRLHLAVRLHELRGVLEGGSSGAPG
ncbi:GAF domain-containing protein [Streptomyces sp. WMMB 322]|uniref:helix-turn-helix domain-containing protein n=1 Tax=Streptomyces sp. WMMB 322 TaxID=1286821 RepID=UPI0008239FE9|nr:GAF domain-containing protein [Streptomyces sp. WMMB 322]SCK37687.1 PucR C-terminal helix-turn-helix domain-containing protein [Streptomyces sp. WMMB 322]